MKKNSKIIALAISLTALIFAGCKNSAMGLSAEGEGLGDDGYKTITITATGDENLIKFPIADSGRTIMADQLDAESMSFYLHYTNKVTGVSTYLKDPLSFTASATNPTLGTVPLTIEDSYYDFTLYATSAAVSNLDGTAGDTTKIRAEAVLMGVTSADLRNSADRIHFYLSPEGLAGGASFELSLYSDGWDLADYSGYTWSAKIVNINDGTTSPGTINPCEGNTTLPTTAGGAAQFTGSGIPGGTYNFVVTFTNGILSFEYSDKIVFLPKTPIVKDVAIPDIIAKIPEAPTDLYTCFKDPLSDESDYYYAGFSWTDNSNNESYFELELLPIGLLADPYSASPSLIAVPAEGWGTSSEATSFIYKVGAGDSDIISYNTDFYGNTDVWVAGSLQKNNTDIVLKLELGKRYLARISAVNDGGKSDPAYVTFDTVAPLTSLGLSDYNKFDDDTLSINRYRLTYELNGGTLTPVTGPAQKTPLIEYRTQNNKESPTDGTYQPNKITASVDIPSSDILNTITDTSTYTSLICNGNAFTYWKKNDITGAKYDSATPSDPYSPPDYTGYDNLVLVACYRTESADVTVFDPTLYNITVDNVTLAGTGLTSTTITNNKVKYNLNTASRSNVSVTVGYTSDQTAAGIEWDKVKVEVKKSNAGSQNLFNSTMTAGSGNFTCSIPFPSYATGKYAVTLTAYASTAYMTNYTSGFEYTFYVDVVEE